MPPHTTRRGSRRRRALLPALLTVCLAVAGALLLASASPTRASEVDGSAGTWKIFVAAVFQNPQATVRPTETPEPSETPKPSETPETTNTPAATATMTPTPSPTSPPLNTSHAGRFTTYEGSKTCMRCHLQQVKAAHGSLHYQWNGPAPYAAATDDRRQAGRDQRLLRLPRHQLAEHSHEPRRPADRRRLRDLPRGHGRHGRARTRPQAQLENVDCLMCHSETLQAQGDQRRRRVQARRPRPSG